MKRVLNAALCFLGGAVIALIFLGIFWYGAINISNEKYKLNDTVIEINSENNSTTLLDEDDNAWEYYEIKD